MMKFPLSSIVVLNYNGGKDLIHCLNSLRSINYPKDKYEIIVVDNASTDGSADIAEERFSEVKIIRNRVNLGFSAGNNIGLKSASGEYLVVLNFDTEVTVNWLSELVRPAERDDNVCLCTSKLLMFNERKILNSAGGSVHYLGFHWPKGFGKQDGQEFNNLEETAAASGCSLLVKREVLQKIGFFDEDYFLYGEDTDLTWRARLYGYEAMYVPSSVVYHRCGAAVKKTYGDLEKLYFLERNRTMTLLKNYSVKALLLLLPMIAFIEFCLYSYFIFILKAPFLKLRGHAWILKNLRRIIQKRSRIQNMRRVHDSRIVSLFVSEFSEYEGAPTLARTLDPILKTYYCMVSGLI